MYARASRRALDPRARSARAIHPHDGSFEAVHGDTGGSFEAAAAAEEEILLPPGMRSNLHFGDHRADAQW